MTDPKSTPQQDGSTTEQASIDEKQKNERVSTYWVSTGRKALRLASASYLLYLAFLASSGAFAIGFASAVLATAISENIHYAQREVSKYHTLKRLATEAKRWEELCEKVQDLTKEQKDQLKNTILSTDSNNLQTSSKVQTYPHALELRAAWEKSDKRYTFKWHDLTLMPRLIISTIYKGAHPAAKYHSSNDLDPKQAQELLRYRLLANYWKHNWSSRVSTLVNLINLSQNALKSLANSAYNAAAWVLTRLHIINAIDTIAASHQDYLASISRGDTYIEQVIKLEASIRHYQLEVAGKIIEAKGEQATEEKKAEVLERLSLSQVESLHQVYIEPGNQTNENSVSLLELVSEVFKFWMVGGHTTLSELLVQGPSQGRAQETVAKVIERHDSIVKGIAKQIIDQRSNQPSPTPPEGKAKQPGH